MLPALSSNSIFSVRTIRFGACSHRKLKNANAMKKILISFFSLSLLFLAFSCEQERAFPEFEDLQYGSFPRRLSFTGEYFITNIATSKITFKVEFYDENQGKNVESYSWAVSYIDRTNNGANNRPAQTIRTVNASQFVTNPDTGLPSTTIEIPLQDVLNLFGFSANDVNGGDSFIFNATLRRTDGKVFTSVNTNDLLEGQPAFNAFFQFRADLKCTPAALAGTYNYSTVGWCGTTQTGTTRLVATSVSGVFNVVSPDAPSDPDAADFSFGAYAACYGAGSTLPGGNLQIVENCYGLRPIGLSRWGEDYWYNSVTVDGPNLIIDWENSYAEGGVTTLTRTDGTNWPPLKKG